jgi:Dolichyl-phosphate-mannose-protein mannosyltransferase
MRPTTGKRNARNVAESTARRSRHTGLLAEGAFVLVVLAGYVGLVAPSLDQPLLETHAFRQTQTAYTARIYHQQGIDLLHPKLPVFGEPFEVPFEFPLLQAAAAVVMDAGVRDDEAMRITGLLSFLVTAVLLYGLVRQVAGIASAVGAIVAFVATPFALLWGRSSMIEYLATAGAVGFAWATIAWRENRRPATGGLALAAGLVGMLVKPTTAVFWVIPALAYRPTRPGGPTSRRRTAWLIALVLVPLAAAVVWTRHADAIKAASPTTSSLTSYGLRHWNFGTVSQRFDRGVWGVILSRLELDLVGYAGMALLGVAAVALVRSSQRWFWIGVGLAAALPPLTFTNLYVVHDYYLAAISPALAALIGLGAGFIWKLLPRNRLIRGVAVAAGVLVASTTVLINPDYWRVIYADDPDPQTRTVAREVASITRADDRIGVVGLDWSPAVLYYADRWGLMVVDATKDTSYDPIQRNGYRYILEAQPAEEDLKPLARWRWLGALTPHLYAIAENATELRGSQFVGTDDPSALSTAHRTLQRGVTIVCGTPKRVRSGRSGTLILISDPSPGDRVSVSDELAPLPTRRAVFVAPELATGGTLTLACSGRPSLVVDVLEAPLPSRS